MFWKKCSLAGSRVLTSVLVTYIAENYAYFVVLLSFETVEIIKIFRNFNEKEYVVLSQKYPTLADLIKVTRIVSKLKTETDRI